MLAPCSSPQVPAPHRAAEGRKTQGAQKDDPNGASSAPQREQGSCQPGGSHLGLLPPLTPPLQWERGEVGESGASASGLPSGAGGPVPVSTNELSALTGGPMSALRVRLEGQTHLGRF